ncbi:HEPN domain-containing protein [Pelagibius marinus]|uniref:ApeA N-terminal domain 1-containing protein n=1 Tax=Pelagibius marinus TaxID=2762760 RepID=UPI0018721E81|nr:HEPN domain-containing protein [Pelagibius marinus]
MIRDLQENTKHAGTFTVAPNIQLYGELTLAGPRTSLFVRSDDRFIIPPVKGTTVTGELYNLAKVTLVDCLIPPIPSSAGNHEKHYHYSNIFPHYVLVGQHHVDPHERDIIKVSFTIDDAFTLFYDFDTFGRVEKPAKLIKEAVALSGLDEAARVTGVERKAELGPHPQIVYFTGKDCIFSANTELGMVSAHHCPSYDFGGPRGIGIENNILLQLSNDNGLTFDEALYYVWTIKSYLDLVVGRAQNLSDISVCIRGTDEDVPSLHVYPSLRQDHDRSDKMREPHPADILIDAVEDSASFSRIMVDWIARQPSWRDARGRFFASFSDQRTYSIDRLVRAANMFDILPAGAVPDSVEVPLDLQSAVVNSKLEFRALPQSPERDSVLNVLGRIGKPNLKRKVRHRAEMILEKTGERFPDLFTVTDEAVNCRNHYVHGSRSRINYVNEPRARSFLTNTLEFVFAASDLIQSGWQIEKWCRDRSGQSHPFGMYRHGYQENLRKLQALLG